MRYEIRFFDLQSETRALSSRAGWHLLFSSRKCVNRALSRTGNYGRDRGCQGRGKSWLNVYIDDLPVRVMRIDPDNRLYQLADDLEDAPHTLTLQKRTEAAFGSIKFTDLTTENGAFLSPPAPLPIVCSSSAIRSPAASATKRRFPATAMLHEKISRLLTAR